MTFTYMTFDQEAMALDVQRFGHTQGFRPTNLNKQSCFVEGTVTQRGAKSITTLQHAQRRNPTV